jgi:excisionase family DNA binding protein
MTSAVNIMHVLEPAVNRNEGAQMTRRELQGVAETAEALGVSVYTVRRLIESGDLKAVHVGARVLIPQAEIDRAITYGVGRPRSRKLRRAAL